MKRLIVLVGVLSFSLVAGSALAADGEREYYVGEGDKPDTHISFSVRSDAVKWMISGGSTPCSDGTTTSIYGTQPHIRLDGNSFKRSQRARGGKFFSVIAGHIRGDTASGRWGGKLTLGDHSRDKETVVCRSGKVRWSAARVSYSEWAEARAQILPDGIGPNPKVPSPE